MALPRPRSSRLTVLAGACAVLALVLDQLSKAWILAVMQPPHSMPVLPPVLSFDLVWNRGVTFGLLSSHAEFLPYAWAALATLIVGILLRWLWKVEQMLVAVPIGMIIGGAIGNVIDRFRFGAVVDFIHVTGYPWVFNVADSAVVVGVALLIWDSFKKPGPEQVRN